MQSAVNTVEQNSKASHMRSPHHRAAQHYECRPEKRSLSGIQVTKQAQEPVLFGQEGKCLEDAGCCLSVFRKSSGGIDPKTGVHAPRISKHRCQEASCIFPAGRQTGNQHGNSLDEN
jgi:hypothetical protein